MSLELLDTWREILDDVGELGDALCRAIEGDDVLAAIATMVELRRARATLARVEAPARLEGDEQALQAMAEVRQRLIHAHGAEAVMTREDHLSGTDRVAEVALGLPQYQLIVNIQGDEPLIDPALIRAVASVLGSNADAAMATAAHPIVDAAEFFNPNVVKVV